MGEGCGSWFPQQRVDQLSPGFNSSSDPPIPGKQTASPEFVGTKSNMISTNGTFPFSTNSQLPGMRIGLVSEPHGWFYCLPRFRQALALAPNSLDGQRPVHLHENCQQAMSKETSDSAKRFLIFDQSGDQMTLVFRSALGTPVKCLASGSANPPAFYLNDTDVKTKEALDIPLGPISADMIYESGNDVQSEMHEDTEELNALLYSDDDSDSTEDEVTSTGHSPSMMVAGEEQTEESTEEIANSVGLTKKRKLFDEDKHLVPRFMNATTSAKCVRRLDCEEDAESRCADGKNPGTHETDSLSGSKRMKREKIQETVSILQNIIPGTKGKDAVVVLDGAIEYLKSLKFKAKTLGLNAL